MENCIFTKDELRVLVEAMFERYCLAVGTLVHLEQTCSTCEECSDEGLISSHRECVDHVGALFEKVRDLYDAIPDDDVGVREVQ